MTTVYPEIIILICLIIAFVVGFVLGRMDRNEKKRAAAEAKREKDLANKRNTEMNIYAGNLPYDLTEEELEASFGMYGEIDAIKIIRDVFSGKSKGFGFIHMSDKGQAHAAIEGLNGARVGDRMLRVNEARPFHKI